MLANKMCNNKKQKSILDHRLYIRLDLDIALKANIFFQGNPYNRAHLANQLLLYDKITIPTKDFGIIPILMSWLGQSNFYESLELETFNFLHLHGMLGYAGNGNGISSFVINMSEDKPIQWWQDTVFGDPEKAIELQLINLASSLGKNERKLLYSIIPSSRWPIFVISPRSSSSLKTLNTVCLFNLVFSIHLDLLPKKE